MPGTTGEKDPSGLGSYARVDLLLRLLREGNRKVERSNPQYNNGPLSSYAQYYPISIEITIWTDQEIEVIKQELFKQLQLNK